MDAKLKYKSKNVPFYSAYDEWNERTNFKLYGILLAKNQIICKFVFLIVLWSLIVSRKKYANLKFILINFDERSWPVCEVWENVLAVLWGRIPPSEAVGQDGFEGCYLVYA